MRNNAQSVSQSSVLAPPKHNYIDESVFRERFERETAGTPPFPPYATNVATQAASHKERAQDGGLGAQRTWEP